MADVIKELASEGIHSKVLEIALRLPGSTIFDAPTGHGALASRLLQAGKTVTAGDIDISKVLIESGNSNLELLQLDLTDPALPIESGQFDTAICVEGVEHLENQWILARNLSRILKPGGYLIITTPNILNFRSRMRFLLEGRYEFFKRPLVCGRSTAHDLDNYHISPVSYFELQFILGNAGFSVKEIYSNKLSSRNILSMMLRPIFKMIYAYKADRDKKRNRGDYEDIYKTIMSDELYYGEILIIVAKKSD